VVARLIHVRRLANAERILRFKVEQQLLGREPDEILVIGAQDRVVAFRQLAKILFLKKTQHGSMRVIVDHVDLPSEDGKKRVAFLKRMVTLFSIRGSLRRLDGMVQLVKDYVNIASPWVRSILARELKLIADYRPRSIDAADFAVVQKMKFRDLGITEQRAFRNAILEFEESNALEWIQGKLSFPTQAARQSFLKAYGRFQKAQEPTEDRLRFLDDMIRVFGRKSSSVLAKVLLDKDEAVRHRAIFFLGELESESGISTMLTMLGPTSSTRQKTAILQALAKMAPSKAVGTLLKLVESPTLKFEVLTTLAAINTGEAALYLKDRHEFLSRESEEFVDEKLLLTRLLGKKHQRRLGKDRELRRKKYQRYVPDVQR